MPISEREKRLVEKFVESENFAGYDVHVSTATVPAGDTPEAGECGIITISVNNQIEFKIIRGPIGIQVGIFCIDDNDTIHPRFAEIVGERLQISNVGHSLSTEDIPAIGYPLDSIVNILQAAQYDKVDFIQSSQ